MEPYYVQQYHNDGRARPPSPTRAYHPSSSYSFDAAKQSSQRTEETQAALTLLALPRSPSSATPVSLPPIQSFQYRNSAVGGGEHIILPPIVPRKGYYKPETDSSPPHHPRPAHHTNHSSHHSSPVLSNSRPGSSRGISIPQLSHSSPHYPPPSSIATPHILLQPASSSRPSSSRDGVPPPSHQMVSLPPPPSQTSPLAYEYPEHDNERVFSFPNSANVRKRKRLSSPSMDEPLPNQSMPTQYHHHPRPVVVDEYGRPRSALQVSTPWVQPQEERVTPAPFPVQHSVPTPPLPPSPRRSMPVDLPVQQPPLQTLPPPPTVTRVATLTTDEQTNCICQHANIDLGTPMICCDMCTQWFHSACVRIDENAVPEKWDCPRCTGTEFGTGKGKGKGGRRRKEKDESMGPTQPGKKKRARRGTVSVNTAAANSMAAVSPSPMEFGAAPTPMSSVPPMSTSINTAQLLPPPPVIPPSLFSSRSSPNYQPPLTHANSQSPAPTPLTSTTPPTMPPHQLSPHPPAPLVSASPEILGSPLDPNTPLTYFPIERDVVNADARPILENLKQKLVRRKERGRKIETALWDGREEDSDSDVGLLTMEEEEDADVDIDGIEPPPLDAGGESMIQVRRFPRDDSNADKIRPPLHSLHAAKNLSSDSFISQYTSEIIPSAEYLADPLNTYVATGLPKPYVRLLPELALDSRRAGNQGRWARRGCHPNAVLRPVICKETREADECEADEEPKEDKTDGVEVKFALFSTKPLSVGEEIVLGWEWDDGHVIHQLPSIIETRYQGMGIRNHRRRRLKSTMKAFLDSLTASFQYCACGSSSRDCAVNQLSSFVEERESPPPPPENPNAKRKPDIGVLVGSKRGFLTDASGQTVRFVGRKHQESRNQDETQAPVRNKGGRPRKRVASPKPPEPSADAALPPRTAYMRSQAKSRGPSEPIVADQEEGCSLPAATQAPPPPPPKGPLTLMPRLKKSWKLPTRLDKEVAEPMVVDADPPAEPKETFEGDMEVLDGDLQQEVEKEEIEIEDDHNAEVELEEVEEIEEVKHPSMSREDSPMIVEAAVQPAPRERSKSSPLSSVAPTPRPVTPAESSTTKSPESSARLTVEVESPPTSEPKQAMASTKGDAQSTVDTSHSPSIHSSNSVISIAHNGTVPVQEAVANGRITQSPPARVEASPPTQSLVDTIFPAQEDTPTMTVEEIKDEPAEIENERLMDAEQTMADMAQKVDDISIAQPSEPIVPEPFTIEPAAEPVLESPAVTESSKPIRQPKTKLSLAQWKQFRKKQPPLQNSIESSVSPQIGVINGLPHSPAASPVEIAAVPVPLPTAEDVPSEHATEHVNVAQDDSKDDRSIIEPVQMEITDEPQMSEEDVLEEDKTKEEVPHSHSPQYDHVASPPPAPALPPTSDHKSASSQSPLQEIIPLASPSIEKPMPSLLARLGPPNGYQSLTRHRSPPLDARDSSSSSRSPVRHSHNGGRPVTPPLRNERQSPAFDLFGRSLSIEQSKDRPLQLSDRVQPPSSVTERHSSQAVPESEDASRSGFAKRSVPSGGTREHTEDGEITGSSPNKPPAISTNKQHALPPTQPRAYGRNSPTLKGRIQPAPSPTATASRAPYTPSTRAPPSGPRALRQQSATSPISPPPRNSREWDRDEWDRRGRERDEQQWRRGLGRNRGRGGGWDSGNR